MRPVVALAMAVVSATVFSGVQTAPLPDNPCDLLDPGTVSAVTGVQISAVRRAVGIDETVHAREEGREPRPGRICVYETPAALTSITVYIPDAAHQHAEEYWDARKKYFATFPGSARPIPGVGKDAWLSGGANLHVLIDGDEYASFRVQMYEPRAGDLLAALARAAIARLGR